MSTLPERSHSTSMAGVQETSHAQSLKRQSSQEIPNSKQAKIPRIISALDDLDDYLLRPAIDYMTLKQQPDHNRNEAAGLGIKLYQAVIDVIHDLEIFKRFLNYRDELAQTLVDALQALLDNGIVEQNFWVVFVSALAGLAIHARLYPQRFVLHGVTYRESSVEEVDQSREAQGLLDGAAVRIVFEKRKAAKSEQHWFREVMLLAQLSHRNVLHLYGLCPSNDDNYFPGLVTNDSGESLWDGLPRLQEIPDPAIGWSLMADIAAGMAYLHENKLAYWEWAHDLAIFLNGTRACFRVPRICFDVTATTIFEVDNKDDFIELYHDLGLWSNDQFQGQNVAEFAYFSYEILLCNIPQDCDEYLSRDYCPAGHLCEGLEQSLWQLLKDCRGYINPKPTASEVVSRLQAAKQTWDMDTMIQKDEANFLVKLATAFLDSSDKLPSLSVRPLQTYDLYHRFLDVFRDLSKYRRFLECRTEQAQVLINAMQTLLDERLVEQEYRSIFIIALAALAIQSQLYPQRFMLQGVTYQVKEGLLTQNTQGFWNGTEVDIMIETRRAWNRSWFGAVVLATQLPAHENVSQFLGLCPPSDNNIYLPGIVFPHCNENLNTFLKSDRATDAQSRRSLIMDIASIMFHLYKNGIPRSFYFNNILENILVTGTPVRACVQVFPRRWYVEPTSLTLWSNIHAYEEFIGINAGEQGPLIGVEDNERGQDATIFYYHACKILDDSRPSLKWLHGAISKGQAMPSGFLHEGLDEHLWQLFLDCRPKSSALWPNASEIVERLDRTGKQWHMTLRRLMQKRQDIVSLLTATFGDKERYRCLLSCDEGKARQLLDILQLLLDIGYFPELDRSQVIAALQRFFKKRDLYPIHFFLESPESAMHDMPAATGGFADIYKVTLRQVETCFKVIRMYQEVEVASLTKLYAKEAIVWAQLSHPNILPFFGISKFQTRLAFVTGWAINGHIVDYLTQNPAVNRMLLCSDTAAGLEYLHRNDIVHGDLKGCNVLIDGSGRALIADFGFANVTSSAILKWTSQSTIGSKGGTTRWHAPELLAIELEDADETDPVIYNTKESDVFAWSNVCYEIFTGKLPFFEVSHPVQVMALIMKGDTPTRPDDDDSAWWHNCLNNRIWDLMTNCWSFEPSHRPDMTTIISRLDEEKLKDTRRPGEWDENSSVRFRNAGKVREVVDSLEFWDGVKSLLLEVVPGLESIQSGEMVDGI